MAFTLAALAPAAPAQGLPAAGERLGTVHFPVSCAAARSGEGLFAREIEVLRLGVEGWLAQANRQPDSAAALLRRAAELEASRQGMAPGPQSYAKPTGCRIRLLTSPSHPTLKGESHPERSFAQGDRAAA